MTEQSVLNEVLAGAGLVYEAGTKMSEMELLMSNQEAMSKMNDSDMENFMNKYGEIQSEFQNLGGYEMPGQYWMVLVSRRRDKIRE